MSEEVPLHVLESKYADDTDDSEDEEATGQHTAAQAEALGRIELALAAATDVAASTDPASRYDAVAATHAEPEEYGEEDDYYEGEYSDEDVTAALEWADFRDGVMERGGAGANFGSASAAQHGPNAGGGSKARSANALQPRSNGMQRLEAHFNTGRGNGPRLAADNPLDALGGSKASTAVSNEVKRESNKAVSGQRAAGKDKADRATVEQAIDPRTRMVLFKMLNRGLFSEINGCVSTGKEANVYHAARAGPGGAEMAIKIYKTSILVFKDRDRYVSGDYRFRNGYCKSNPRKMVQMWAEKEMRNLSRLRAAGIKAPAPIELRLHVLVMEFIGEDGVAAPRLRDARIPPDRMRSVYTEMLLIVRTLYQTCKLVHADLSEYNILYDKGELYIIDVSQAVDLDHPKALDFLREDCKHINDYFRRQDIATLTVRELFDFAVDGSINESNLDDALARLMEIAASRPIGSQADEDKVADNVFAQAFIPRCLDEVSTFERDQARMKAAGGGEVEGIYYQAITGMRGDLSGARSGPRLLEVGVADAAGAAAAAGSSGAGDAAAAPAAGADGAEAAPSGAAGEASSSGSDDDDSDDNDSDDGSWSDGEEGPNREEVRAARKANKKAVKEANKARRKTKTPKHVKKGKIAKGKGSKTKK
ncbi:hypothetical protein FOA52_014635 [Chlamydomonas sp. UWO 241]|nr:hypothetical protein FOA52_014635 [Chlamydomonas sp. UWO 241]